MKFQEIFASFEEIRFYAVEAHWLGYCKLLRMKEIKENILFMVEAD